jgi:hypothetical protein
MVPLANSPLTCAVGLDGLNNVTTMSPFSSAIHTNTY